MYCPKCKVKIYSDIKTCPNCGRALVDKETLEQMPEKKIKHPVALVFGILFLISGFGVLIGPAVSST